MVSNLLYAVPNVQVVFISDIRLLYLSWCPLRLGNSLRGRPIESLPIYFRVAVQCWIALILSWFTESYDSDTVCSIAVCKYILKKVQHLSYSHYMFIFILLRSWSRYNQATEIEGVATIHQTMNLRMPWETFRNHRNVCFTPRTPVDGSEILQHLGCIDSVNNGIFTISAGFLAGFLNHQQLPVKSGESCDLSFGDEALPCPSSRASGLCDVPLRTFLWR